MKYTKIICVVLVCYSLLITILYIQDSGRIHRTSNTPPEEMVRVTNIWPVYTDTSLGFSIQYPTGLVAKPFEGGVSFSEPETGFGWGSVSVGTLDDPKRFKFNTNRRTLEKSFTVDGYSAIVYYPHDNIESFPYEKTLEVVKGDRVFFVYARGTNMDFESLWNSFHFTD